MDAPPEIPNSQEFPDSDFNWPRWATVLCVKQSRMKTIRTDELLKDGFKAMIFVSLREMSAGNII
ncbi:MAG TPA: hypothetical protein VFC41_02750 [Anaerovoracaceae bacterium]|nr:hypothetical protein [Anaerovoracaceae bacterium]